VPDKQDQEARVKYMVAVAMLDIPALVAGLLAKAAAGQ
jgi:hypothetical protein